METLFFTFTRQWTWHGVTWPVYWPVEMACYDWTKEKTKDFLLVIREKKYNCHSGQQIRCRMAVLFPACYIIWSLNKHICLLAPALLGLVHFASQVFERIIADQPDSFFFLRFNRTHPAEFLCLWNKWGPACCTRTWPSDTAACWLTFLFFAVSLHLATTWEHGMKFLQTVTAGNRLRTLQHQHQLFW